MPHVDGDRSPYQCLSYQPESTRNKRARSVSTARRIPSSPSSANVRKGAMAGPTLLDCCVC